MRRLGFVSNSSSCSFICPVCDNHQGGWDWNEDPVCNKCGVHMNNVKGNFTDYLIRKYHLDEAEERALFRSEQDGDPDY